MMQLTSIFRFFKENEKLLLYMALILAVAFWNRSCTAEPKVITRTVTTPYIHGAFTLPIQPRHEVLDVDSLIQSIKDTLRPDVVVREKVIRIAQKENTELLEEYQDLKDEYERYKLFQSFASVKEFTHTFEDERLQVNVQGLVRGHVSSLTIPNYTIKPIDVDVEIKQARKKHFSIGPYVGYDFHQLKPSFGISLNYSLFRL